jgi:uncharacterized membrane protein YgcG
LVAGVEARWLGFDRQRAAASHHIYYSSAARYTAEQKNHSSRGRAAPTTTKQQSSTGRLGPTHSNLTSPFHHATIIQRRLDRRLKRATPGGGDVVDPHPNTRAREITHPHILSSFGAHTHKPPSAQQPKMSDAMDVVAPVAAPTEEQQQQQQSEAAATAAAVPTEQPPPQEQPPAAPAAAAAPQQQQQEPAAGAEDAPDAAAAAASMKAEEGAAVGENGAAAETNPAAVSAAVPAAAATTSAFAAAASNGTTAAAAPAGKEGGGAKFMNFRKLEVRALLWIGCVLSLVRLVRLVAWVNDSVFLNSTHLQISTAPRAAQVPGVLRRDGQARRLPRGAGGAREQVRTCRRGNVVWCNVRAGGGCDGLGLPSVPSWFNTLADHLAGWLAGWLADGLTLFSLPNDRTVDRHRHHHPHDRHFDKEPVDEDMVLHCFFMSGMQAANTLGKFDKKRKRGGGGGGAAYYAGAGYAGGGGGGGGGARGGAGSGGRGPLGPHQIAKVDEEVAARPPNAQPADDSTAGWILARVAKYSAERDQYQVRDEEEVLTIPSSGVIRLHEAGEHLGDVQKGDTVLAVFPDTTSFYRAQVTKVPKQQGQRGGEVHVKFDDDEDETGRTPHRRVPSRHVLKLSQVGGLGGGGEGYEGGVGVGGGGGGGGERTRKGARDYKAMISHALQKLPNSKGTLKEIFRIIETDFRDELQWKLEGEGKKTPMWKNQVRKLLVNPRSGFMFINAGERGAYYAEGEGGGGM